MKTYLEWLAGDTHTKWWHDSAIPEEIDEAVEMGALGVTTNPVLTYKTLQAAPEFWQKEVYQIPQTYSGQERAEALLKMVATYAAAKMLPIYEETNGENGYAFGQVNPMNCGNSQLMLEQGLRYASWAPNVAVKIPTTRAALPVVEELAAEGVAVCTTLNFSVAQAIAAA
ncbi:MAG: transaldolase family protein, partial [Oscillospiraceae bacterium]